MHFNMLQLAFHLTRLVNTGSRRFMKASGSVKNESRPTLARRGGSALSWDSGADARLHPMDGPEWVALQEEFDKATTQLPAVLYVIGDPESPEYKACQQVLAILRTEGLDLDDIACIDVGNGSDDANGSVLRLELIRYTEWFSIPQLFVHGEFVGGVDLVVNLHETGELANIVRGRDVTLQDAALPTS